MDGRKLRWIDCDWNNLDGGTACETCRVCRYLDFLDFAHSVGKPEGPTIEYNRTIDKYVDATFKNIEEKKEYLLSITPLIERGMGDANI